MKVNQATTGDNSPYRTVQIPPPTPVTEAAYATVYGNQKGKFGPPQSPSPYIGNPYYYTLPECNTIHQRGGDSYSSPSGNEVEYCNTPCYN